MIHNKMKYICEKCNKIFSRKSSYDYHVNRKISCIKEENEERNIQRRTCPKCNKILSSVCAMKTHLKTCKKQASSEIEELKKLLLTMNNRITKIESNLK